MLPIRRYARNICRSGMRASRPNFSLVMLTAADNKHLTPKSRPRHAAFSAAEATSDLNWRRLARTIHPEVDLLP